MKFLKKHTVYTFVIVANAKCDFGETSGDKFCQNHNLKKNTIDEGPWLNSQRLNRVSK